jgi:hypothetical protein
LEADEKGFQLFAKMYCDTLSAKEQQQQLLASSSTSSASSMSTATSNIYKVFFSNLIATDSNTNTSEQKSQIVYRDKISGNFHLDENNE